MRSFTLMTVALLASLAAADVGSSWSAAASSDKSDESASSSKVTTAPKTTTTAAPNGNTNAGCKLETFDLGALKNQVASLKDYALTGPVGVTDNATSGSGFLLSPCSAANLTAESQGACVKADVENAFAVRVDGAGKCLTAYTTIAGKMVFDNNTQTFTVIVATADAQETLIINVFCEAGADGTTGNFTKDDGGLFIGSKKVCGEARQPVKTLAPGACNIDFEKYDETYEASLENFDKVSDKKVNTAGAVTPVAISPCGKVSFADNKDLMNCSATPGFMAFNGVDGNCVVLENKVVTYDPNTFEFNSTFYSGANMLRSGLLGATEDEKRHVIVQCGATDSNEGVQDGNTVTYTSKGACGTETKATQAPKEDKGLSTGAIVGIIIGCLALIVIILVICRWKSAKTEEEGEYSRV